jgi:hypothetical protein
MMDTAQQKLRARAIAALEATAAYDSRGPKTFRARRNLAQWVETGYFLAEYLAMATPEAACRWLEYVVRAERGKARLEAIRCAARDAEERL